MEQQTNKSTLDSDEDRQIPSVRIHHPIGFKFRLQHPSFGGFRTLASPTRSKLPNHTEKQTFQIREILD
jgi:hypothetical protein